MALAPQQFCVRWNSYHTNLQAVFPRLLSTEHFADVTLACESQQLKCHKLVLSACSAYFERLLVQNPCKHPIVFMKDMRFSEMQALVDFMYKGEVNVTQDELPSLLKSAEALQIRGLCSGDTSGLTSETNGSAKGTDSTKDYTVASEALLQGQTNNKTDVSSKSSPSTNGAKKRKSEERESRASTSTDVKQETVEEDGLFYGDLHHDHMDYNEDEDPGKAGSSLSQPSDFAIANVQCQYDSPSDTDSTSDTTTTTSVGVVSHVGDHNYDAEPPAFIIKQVNIGAQIPNISQSFNSHPFVEVAPKIMTLGPSYVPSSVNVIHVQSNRQEFQDPMPPMQPECNKRIRRSEVVLKQAADCVSRGLTFQTVSEQFNIPISTIRFFMARKGILPRRRRGRSSNAISCTSPEPPYHMQHFKLPNMVALKSDCDEDSNEQK